MKIHSTSFKNKTIYNPSKLKLNSKLLKKVTSSSLKSSDNIKKDNELIKVDKKKLNNIYLTLNKNIKMNIKKKKNNINNVSSLYNEKMSIGDKSRYVFLHNVLLANVINMENFNLKTIDVNNQMNNINMNKYFEKYNKNSAKSYDEGSRNQKNKNNKLYNSIDNDKRYESIFATLRVKGNIKYIKQYPYFNDLNLQPSSEKSWLFAYEKKKPTILSRNLKYGGKNDNRKYIPKFNFINKANNSNLTNKMQSYNTFFIEEYKNKKLNIRDSNSNYNNYRKKNEKIIFNYNFINKGNNHNKEYKSKNKSQINNKGSRLIISNYGNHCNKSSNIKKNNIVHDVKKVFRLKSCKNYSTNRKYIINNYDKNISNFNNENYKENNKDSDMSTINVDIISNNISSFDNLLNEDEDFISINPIFS